MQLLVVLHDFPLEGILSENFDFRSQVYFVGMQRKNFLRLGLIIIDSCNTQTHLTRPSGYESGLFLWYIIICPY